MAVIANIEDLRSMAYWVSPALARRWKSSIQNWIWPWHLLATPVSMRSSATFCCLQTRTRRRTFGNARQPDRYADG